MCEKCLYRNNCQFIATHENYKTVTGCTAFRSEQQIKSDVAREIFEEIENNYADFLYDGYRNIVVLTEKDFEELKKKYESEGEG